MNFAIRFVSVLPLVAGCLFGCSAGGDDSGNENGDDIADQESALSSKDAGPDASAASSVFVDARDKQAYATVKIGTKRWFARNLNFKMAGSSFCYDDAPGNCDSDGRLYTWSAAKTACPVGTHLGSDADWKALEKAIGMPSSDLNLEGYSTVRGSTQGTQLKSKNGFSAKMAGFRTGATYDARGDRTYYWTSTMRGSEVWRRRISQAEPTVFRFTNAPDTFAISVRCVVD